MIIHEYIVKDNDSIQKIATQFFNDPKRWVDIVSYNRLDYPFITSDQNFVRDVRATGIVLLKGTGISVPKGTVLWSSDLPDKRYETLTAANLTIQNAEAMVSIRSLLSGELGNIVTGSIDSSSITGLTIQQDNHLINGRFIRVRKTGESLFIPTEQVTSMDLESFLDTVGGEDLLLEDGDFSTDVYRDLTSVSGLDNISQRIRHRLETERGELPLHPAYGSNIYQFIGREEPYIDDLIRLEVQQVVLEDPAVEAVENVTIRKVGTSVYYDCVARLSGYHELATISGNITA